MRFTGTTVLRIQNGKIVEEIGLDDGVTALQQLGLIRAVCSKTRATADIRLAVARTARSFMTRDN